MQTAEDHENRKEKDLLLARVMIYTYDDLYRRRRLLSWRAPESRIRREIQASAAREAGSQTSNRLLNRPFHAL